MFDQSITGIRTNLDAFAQAATRIASAYTTNVPPDGSSEQAARGIQTEGPSAEKNRANPQDAEQAARAQNAYRNTNAASTKPSERSQRETGAATNESTTAKESATKSGWANTNQPVDEAAETAKMMIAKQGANANVAALKTAMALSGQTVDLLA